MAANSGLRSRITEIATCPICLEDFKDPRLLPCGHSFCLQCLQGVFEDVFLGDDEFLGDDVPCPLCRKEFQIPEDGLDSLSHNFCLQNLVDAKTAKTICKPGVCCCEPCLEDGRSKPASLYCVHCSQKLCNRCSTPHKNLQSGPHDVKAIEAEYIGNDSCCTKYLDKRLEFYCYSCKRTICVKCFGDFHRQHQCEFIENVSRHFKTSIQYDIEPFPFRISQFREAIRRIKMSNKYLMANITRTECEVQKKADEIKRLVDDHVSKLLQELRELRERLLTETETSRKSLELALAALESFHAYSSELVHTGSVSDIARAADDIHERAGELLKTHVTPGYCSTATVRFEPANYVEAMPRGSDNVVGSLQRSNVIHETEEAEFVWGVTVLNNELYVLRDRDADDEQIDIYSTADFTLQRRLSVNGLSIDMRDITSCVQKQCVYVADSGNFCVHRVGLDKSVTKWPVEVKPWSLSVTPSSNLLVTCRSMTSENFKLIELSTEDGKLVRKLQLQSYSSLRFWPQHSIQLANRQYIICHGAACGNSGVSLFNLNGDSVRTNSEEVGLVNADYLAMKDSQFYFVVDVFTARIVLFELSVKYAGNVLQLLRGRPMRLCYDDVTRRLYVGQDNGIVSVVQL